MKRTLLAGIAPVTLAFAPQIASAADVPVRKAPAVPVAAAPSWNGLYVGFVAGWLRYNARWEDLETTAFGIRTFDNVDGGTIGGTVGWNWQIFPAWVIGVEADWSWANVRGSSLCPEFAFAAQCGIKIKDVGTVRGRFGYVWGSALVYATGGWTSIGTDTTFEV